MRGSSSCLLPLSSRKLEGVCVICVKKKDLIMNDSTKRYGKETYQVLRIVEVHYVR